MAGAKSEDRRRRGGVMPDALDTLIARHPKLFRGAPPTIPSDLPPGWLDLADALCAELERALGPQTEPFEVQQVKQKFGELRFYWSFEGHANGIADFISPEDVQTVVFPADGLPVMERLRSLMATATETSRMTCEVCGSAGMRRSLGGFITARCESHASGHRGSARDSE